METQSTLTQQPLQPTTPTEPVVPPISEPVFDQFKLVVSKKSPLVPILIILLVLAVSAAIYFYLQSRIVIPAPVTSEGSTPAPTANIDPTANWQTYTNLRYHYSFKYPSDWKISFEDTYQYSNVTISSPTDKSINVVQFTGNPEADKPNFTKNFVVDENNSLMASFTHCPSGPGSDCAGAQTIEDIELFKQILQTFQFTDQDNLSDIVITKPSPQATVTSPVEISGTVPSIWMFEGQFSIEIRDNDGNIIGEGVAKEDKPGTWVSSERVNFTATITFTPSGKTGTIVLLSANPSGIPQKQNSYSLIVKFE